MSERKRNQRKGAVLFLCETFGLIFSYHGAFLILQVYGSLNHVVSVGARLFLHNNEFNN